MEAHVLREDGSEADVNEAGKLYIQSECVVLCYWIDKKAMWEAFANVWLCTGDLVQVDQNGHLS